MIKKILPFAFLFFGLTSNADTPPDFTMTAINGTTYNLHTELARNKPVVLVFFNLYCGTCQAAVPTLENVWVRDAQQGNEGWVWAFENGNATNEQIEAYFQEFGGSFIAFRTAGDDSILTSQFGYNITYTPQYFVACTDFTYKRITYDLISEVFLSCKTATGIENVRNQVEVGTEGNSIFVTLPRESGQVKIMVVDILGRVSTQITSSTPQQQYFIDKPAMPGLYIVNVQLENGKRFSRKLVVTR
jgi:hypothetical protein